MYLALTILLNILFAIALVAAVPVVIAAAWDPTRQVDAWLADARAAWERGERATAVRLVDKAMWWSARGRYSARQARASLAALEVLETLVGPLPDPVEALRQALASGRRRVDPAVVQSARERLASLADAIERSPAER